MATYNSDYFDYSYERTSYSKYVKYNLTAPEDSVSVNVSKASMYTPGTVDYEITEDAEYFKSEIERADDWMDDIVTAIVTSIPAIGSAYAAQELLIAFNEYQQEPSVMEFLNTIKNGFSLIPGGGLLVSGIEIVAKGPVVWTHLFNARGAIDRIQNKI